LIGKGACQMDERLLNFSWTMPRGHNETDPRTLAGSPSMQYRLNAALAQLSMESLHINLVRKMDRLHREETTERQQSQPFESLTKEQNALRQFRPECITARVIDCQGTRGSGNVGG
jgi:hypothetical protein